MRLRNGADEEQAVVAPVVSALRDLKEDHGPRGLLIALRTAKGAPVRGTILGEYGLTTRRKMGQSVKNVILSAVTDKGELVSPYE